MARYGSAMFLVALATAVREELARRFGLTGATYITYYPSTLLAALLAGLGPGILTTLLSGAAAAYFVLEPLGFGVKHSGDIIGLAIFTASGIGASVLVERLDRTRRRAAEELRAGSLYARSLIEASLDPLVTISAEGKITDVNKATEDATGIPRSVLIGTDFSIYFSEPEKARAGYREVFERGQVIDYPLALRHASGKTLDVLYNASVYRDESGAVAGVFAAARDVTERKRAEETIRLQAQRYATILNTTISGFWVIDLKGKLLEVNEAYAQMSGYSREELLRLSVPDLEAKENPAQVAEQIEKIRANGFDHFERRQRRKDGSVFDVEISASYWPETDQILLFARDITARKRAEAELRAASLYARSLIEASLDPLVTISAEGKITDVNKATEEATGVPRSSLIGKDFADYFTEPEKARAGYREVFERGQVIDYPLALRHASGETMDVLYNASVYRDESGAVAGVFAAARDVTERKHADAELRSASLYARTLIEASLDPLVTISAEGKITDVNKATEEATGVPRSSLIGKDFADYFTEPEKARAGYREVFERGQVIDYPLALRHASGKTMDVLYNARVYRDESGAAAGVFAAARDVSQLRQEQRALQRSEERFRSLVTATAQVVWTTDAQGQVTVDQPSLQTFTGRSFEQTKGSGWLESLHQEDRERTAAVWGAAVRERKLYQIEYRMHRHDGEYRDIAARGVPVLEPGGSIREWVGTCTDITEQKRAEQELAQHRQHLEELVEQRTGEIQSANQRLEASNQELETFAYSVSHDLRTPLRAVDGFSRILVEDYAARLDSEGQRIVGVIRESTRKMAQMIDDILAFSRAGRVELSLRPIDVDELVRGVLKDLEPALAGRDLKIEIKPLAPSHGDVSMIQRVWSNLLDNAIKFTKPKSAGVIEVGSQSGEQESIYYVKDNGVGFDMQYAHKLFGVFQRLHAVDEFPGTGIGLAIVKRIVARHGGRVWAEGKVGQGATVYFALPSGTPS